MSPTGDPERPAMLWPVDGASIRINAKWDGQEDTPRYAQAMPGQPESSAVELRDDQLMYIRMNPRSFTPFGLGPLEVAFETVNQFLSAHRFAGKLAANSVAQYALWLNEATPVQHDRLIRDVATNWPRPPVKRLDLRVDISELGVAIRTFAGFLGLAVGMATIFQFLEAAWEWSKSSLVAQGREGAVASCRCGSWRPIATAASVADRRRLEQSLRVLQQRRVLTVNRGAPRPCACTSPVKEPGFRKSFNRAQSCAGRPSSRAPTAAIPP